MKQVYELLVRVPVENQHAAIGVKRHFQHAPLRPRVAGVGKSFAISVKTDHEYPPCCRKQRYQRLAGPDPVQATPDGSEIFENSGPSPSAIVRCEMTASRRRGFGSFANIEVCPTDMTSPASEP